MKTVLTSLLLFFTILVLAQNNAPFFRGAGAIGEGNHVSTTLGIQSLFGNPAGLCQMDGLSFYAGAENRFELIDLTAYQLAIALPVDKWGVFGLNLTDFGGSLYRDQKIGLVYARNLTKKFAIGLQFDWMIMEIEQYGMRHRFTFDIGIQTNLTDKLLFGFHLFSPYPMSFDVDRIVPTYASVGLVYRVSQQVELKVEVQKQTYENPALHIGLHYKIMKSFSLSMGMTTNTGHAIISSGFSYQFPVGLKVDFGMNFHQSLGISSGIGFCYGFRRKTSGNLSSVESD
ncbi:MAG TPA: hypothetical protein DCX89_08935 [Saprospirales bacterium]|nr:hypothetical protein [Saprospirales bacterium]HAY72002.1 hypothetical protein [Saprospirales bacterium]HRQ28822.1 hypothetical protein [Saprospiraceae bacterium]